MTARAPDKDRRQEIIIVRRKKRGGDGHHGGAWKIAFADFMTAMMALFLVLWLVNAANEETKKSVASYFNPVKLVDRYRSERGLSEADGPSRKRTETDENTDPVPENKASGEADDASKDASAVAAEKRTAAFFADADAVIDGLTKAAEAEKRMEISQWDTPIPAGDDTPERLRDPFATDIVVEAALRAENGDAADDIPVRVAVFETDQADSSEAAPEVPDTAGTKPDDSPAEPPAAAFEEPMAETVDSALSGDGGQDVAEAVRAVLANASSGTALDNATVTITPEGTLISLVDSTGEPMFERSSAHPTVMLVQMLNGLAGTIADGQRTIRISGHTDATPFAESSGYDNWRLSTDRANTARLILEKAGVVSTAIASVAGYADRRPIQPDNPLADENRRIEILLESGV